MYTHFELMRNDCLIPLQKAVKAYKEVYGHTKTKEDQGAAMEAGYSQQPYRLYEHVKLHRMSDMSEIINQSSRFTSMPLCLVTDNHCIELLFDYRITVESIGLNQKD